MGTLAESRRDLARRAYALRQLTTGVYYSSSYQGTASGTDAGRRIISSDLASSNLTNQVSELPAQSVNYDWIWVPSTGEQRRIVANGYTSRSLASAVLTGQAGGADSLIVGYYTVDRAFASTLAANIAVEAIGRFPVLSNERLPGLHWALNEALSVMHWPFKVSVSGVSNQTRYDITSVAPWVKQTGQLIRVFRPQTNSAVGPDPMRGPAWLEPDGEKMYLFIPEGVNTGSTFTVQLRRPLDTWIKVAGTWATSTVGMVNETDESLPETDVLTTVAYSILTDRMAKIGPKPQSEEWSKEAASAAEEAKPYLEVQVEPMTPKRDWPYRTPRAPSGKAWWSTPGRVRRWP